MWGRGVDVCGYFAGRGGGNPTPKFFQQKMPFLSFITIYSSNDRKTLGIDTRTPRGDDPLNLMGLPDAGMPTDITEGTSAHLREISAAYTADRMPLAPISV